MAVLHEDIPEEDIELIPMIEWYERMREDPQLRNHYSKTHDCERDSDCNAWSNDLICKTLYDKDTTLRRPTAGGRIGRLGIVKRKNECVRDKKYSERRAARQEAARQEAEHQVAPGGRCTNGWRMFNCLSGFGGSRQGGGMKRRKINYHKKKSKRKIS